MYLDHIKAGKAMTIYHDLKLDKLDCTVAIIKNATQQQNGQKGHYQGGMPYRECWILIFWDSLTTISP